MNFLKIRSSKLCVILIAIGVFFIGSNSNMCCFSKNIVKAMEDSDLVYNFDSTGVYKAFNFSDFFL